MVSATTLAIEFADGDTRVIRRTTTEPVRSIKGQSGRGPLPQFLDHVSHIRWQNRVAHQSSDHTARQAVTG